LTDKNQLLELMYDDELILQAERLYEAGAVTDLDCIETNLYVCKVKDGRNYEIEIQSPFTKKQKAVCECTFFIQHHICKHVVAGLMQIREDRNRKKTTKEANLELKEKKKLSSLNINQILEEISHEDLKAFIKSFARTDRKLATHLKVTFARKIDISDNAEKYKSILNTLIRPHTGELAKANSSEIRSAIQVMNDFADQINDCIALGQYREAFNIYAASFAKLEYIRHYYTVHSEALTLLSKSYHKIIHYFLSEKLAPELKSDLLSFLIDLAGRSYYHFTDPTNNIIYQLHCSTKLKEDSRIKIVVEELLNSKPTKEKAILLSLWIITSGKFTAEHFTFLKPFHLYHIEVIDILLSLNEDGIALKFLESLYQAKKPDKELVNRLVFLYVRFKKIPKLKETAKLAYINSGDLKYIEVIKRELDGSEYIDFIHKLEEELLNVKVDPNLLIKIYRKEENWSGLLLFLDKLNNIELVKQHDSVLYKFEKNALAQLYIHLIKLYLDEHIGDSAFLYLESLKNHWNQQKLDNVVFQVNKFIKENYGHRPKLVKVFE